AHGRAPRGPGQQVRGRRRAVRLRRPPLAARPRRPGPRRRPRPVRRDRRAGPPPPRAERRHRRLVGAGRGRQRGGREPLRVHRDRPGCERGGPADRPGQAARGAGAGLGRDRPPGRGPGGGLAGRRHRRAPGPHGADHDLRAARRRGRRAGRGVGLTPVPCGRGTPDSLLPMRHDHLLDLPLDVLTAEARRVRDATTGTRVTYSPKVFIPLTTLCRDRCGYCTFAQPPARVASPYLSPDEVLAIATAGARAGCHEALFTLGERPEERYPAAAEWLAEHGYESTVHYLAEMCRLVLDRTGLLPHANAGALHEDELALLREVAPSQGMMLE